MSWTFTLWIALLLVVLMGFFAGIAYLAGFTLLGTEVEDEIRGRTFAIVQSLVRAALILSLAVVPFGVGLIGRHHARPRRRHASRSPASGSCCSSPGCSPSASGVLAYRQMDDGRPVPLLADVVTALRRDTTARRRLAGGGVFIAFEGGEGAGKSTQVRRLQEWLTNEGLVARATFEPGATPSGRRDPRRSCSTGRTPAIASRSEALLYAADRAQHVHDVLRPALDAGEVVITDRFVDSSLAYQGAGRTIPLDDVRMLSRWATEGLQPDLTVLLDLPPEVGLARARGRAVADRLESESLDFHQRVRQTFRALAEAEPDRYLVLDARQHARRDRRGHPGPGGRAAVRACRCSSSPQPAPAAGARADRRRRRGRTIRTPRPARPRSCTRDAPWPPRASGRRWSASPRSSPSCARRSPTRRR